MKRVFYELKKMFHSYDINWRQNCIVLCGLRRVARAAARRTGRRRGDPTCFAVASVSIFKPAAVFYVVQLQPQHVTSTTRVARVVADDTISFIKYKRYF
ncbi:hypothetical protein EVAR_43675_1 [Eumeta japonica]|uniref:Uncharacterized protein n=1 Tax=Eumeta variegata TaxID=151549 RepID=A0A4C1X0Q8_EUMVA|nr:hypothetical protein EVAR_43675_1 [Eumeta japonica]